MQDYIIDMYGTLLRVFVWVGFGLGAVLGWLTFRTLGDNFAGFLGALFVGGLVFVLSASVAGYFFTQLKIKDLLEEQTGYLKRLAGGPASDMRHRAAQTQPTQVPRHLQEDLGVAPAAPSTPAAGR